MNKYSPSTVSLICIKNFISENTVSSLIIDIQSTYILKNLRCSYIQERVSQGFSPIVKFTCILLSGGRCFIFCKCFFVCLAMIFDGNVMVLKIHLAKIRKPLFFFYNFSLKNQRIYKDQLLPPP